MVLQKKKLKNRIKELKKGGNKKKRNIKIYVKGEIKKRET